MITIPIKTAGNSRIDLPEARNWASGIGASPPPKSPEPARMFRALSAVPTDIRYMAVGTAESARNILAGSGDFGGGDAPISEAQVRAFRKSILLMAVGLVWVVKNGK